MTRIDRDIPDTRIGWAIMWLVIASPTVAAFAWWFAAVNG